MPGAQRSEHGPLQSLAAWGGDHARACVASLGRLSRAPMPSLMTALVIAIALALPGGFLLLLSNMERVTGGWEGSAQISLFMADGVGEAQYRSLGDELRAHPAISMVDIVPPDAALDEFRRLSGFEDALELLDRNPLPPVLLVRPSAGLAPEQVQALAGDLRTRAEVAQLRLDQEWVQRLHALMQLVERGVWVIALLLAMTVVLVVGNTIRLDIQNRRDEIVITKLIGATDGFVRRPFLYEGLWYGLVGGVIAVVLIEAGRLLMSGPARDLALSYGSGFGLHGIGLVGIGQLTLAGGLLGLIGSWTAVGRHLKAVEPR